MYEHKSVMVRKNQFNICDSIEGLKLAKELIIGKLKNQRATLLYSSRNIDEEKKHNTISNIDKLILQLKNKNELSREFILGIEGVGATYYLILFINLVSMQDLSRIVEYYIVLEVPSHHLYLILWRSIEAL